MIRLSFLLPCYKVEKYIQECVDSIFNANLPLKDFEVLCFDDCSPDGTPQLLDKLAQAHNNFHVIHAKENVGSGGGRNALLEKAKGQYIWFIDPDDLVASENVLPMLKQAENNALDVMLFNYVDVNEEGEKLPSGSVFPDTQVLNGLSFVEEVFGNNIVSHIGYPWRFIVRREYLINNKIFFPERMVFQDTVWMPELMIKAACIQAASVVGYLYRHHNASVCGRFDTIYPGRSIYTWSIMVSNLLLAFSDELEKKRNEDSRFHDYAVVFHDFAIVHYINALPILLSRTQRAERKAFYTIVKERGVPMDVKRNANVLTRMLLMRGIGYYISNVVAFIYIITHR